MAISIGARLRCSASTCEVVVTRTPSTDEELTCAGAIMTADQIPARETAPAEPGGPEILLGKRYYLDGSGLEVLCVKPGVGPLAFAGKDLELRPSKVLPSSD